MKPQVCFIFLYLIFLSCSSSKSISKVNTDESIFRYTVLASGDTLFLDKQTDLLSVYGDSINKNTYRVPMSFPGVESMFVKTSSVKDIVKNQLFIYDQSYDFDKEIKSYAKDFGKPDSFYVRPYLKAYYWNDGVTLFQMMRFQSETKDQSYSILRSDNITNEFSFDFDKLEKLRGNYSTKDIIATSKIFSIILNQDQDILAKLQSSLPDSLVRRLTPLVNKHYSSKRLYSYIEDYIISESKTETTDSLFQWLFSEWFIELSYKTDNYQPEKTIEEYVSSIRTNPPPRNRSIIFYDFVKANNAGSFFYDIQTATSDVINDIFSLFGYENLRSEPISEEARSQLINQYELSTLVSFLWKMKPLTNDEVSKMTSAYNSKSGSWYVETYSDAVANSISRAGNELLFELREID